MKMEQRQWSETSAIKHHTPENNPKDYTRQPEKLFSNIERHTPTAGINKIMHIQVMLVETKYTYTYTTILIVPQMVKWRLKEGGRILRWMYPSFLTAGEFTEYVGRRFMQVHL
jgi:hypothetical protein